MSDSALELRDQLSIDTPELVSLQLPLAGTGSRAISCLLDYAIQGLAFFAFVLLLALVATLASNPATPAHDTHQATGPGDIWAAAIVGLVMFVCQWGYFTLFEAFWNGRTPGKRLLHLRVIQQDGRSIGFLDALTRNLLRIVDGLPGFYLVGIVLIFATSRSQRLGDLAAGTVVVHEQKIETPNWEGSGARHLTVGLSEAPLAAQPARSTGIPADQVGRLTQVDLETIESFLARKLDLSYETSSALAARIARQMAAKMGTAVPADIGPDTFLESLASEMRSLGGHGRL